MTRKDEPAELLLWDIDLRTVAGLQESVPGMAKELSSWLMNLQNWAIRIWPSLEKQADIEPVCRRGKGSSFQSGGIIDTWPFCRAVSLLCGNIYYILYLPWRPCILDLGMLFCESLTLFCDSYACFQNTSSNALKKVSLKIKGIVRWNKSPDDTAVSIRVKQKSLRHPRVLNRHWESPPKELQASKIICPDFTMNPLF